MALGPRLLSVHIPVPRSRHLLGFCRRPDHAAEYDPWRGILAFLLSRYLLADRARTKMVENPTGGGGADRRCDLCRG